MPFFLRPLCRGGREVGDWWFYDLDGVVLEIVRRSEVNMIDNYEVKVLCRMPNAVYRPNLLNS